MNMSVAFDTLSYANQMKQAGFTAEQAEVQTKALASVMSELTEGALATKQDVLEFKYELKQDIEVLRHEFKQDLTEVEKKLENKIQEVETKLTIRLGAIMASGIAIISALMIILKLT